MKLKSAYGLLLLAAASIYPNGALFAQEESTYENILKHRTTESFQNWQDSKYSMFIHFGLYSELGGVWDGKPVKWGYSEQIQSFGGIFSDWYAMTADQFDPTEFDADEIVSLAKRAGMKSIVITSKHHDGFCMFDTETTDFNSVDATPAKRDYIREMANACKKAGMNLGLYFSVIDWHYPQAAPISSHNCDFITPEHHEYNKAQITELLTNYGKISELWFDMGSQVPEQSRELYELVHKLQPDCLVSGRVGNDYYDFAVMGDNQYPETTLQAPWQSAASMFNETWGYRSWQVREDSGQKAAEKLRSLIKVVSHGGNYLLNIGPDDEGSVVGFEKDVLLEIGKWLEKNGEAIYGTTASPFRENFEWGYMTQKGKDLYLILSGKKTSKINLEIPDNDLLYAVYLDNSEEIKYKQSKKGLALKLPVVTNEKTTDIPVVKLSFRDPVEPQAAESIEKEKNQFILNSRNAVKDYSYSCFDYYSNYRSVVGYNWNVEGMQFNEMEIGYTEAEIGKTVCIEIDGVPVKVKLQDRTYEEVELPAEMTSLQNRYIERRIGSFDSNVLKIADCEDWKEVESEVTEKSAPFTNHFIMRQINAPEKCEVIFDYISGNGTEIIVNGETIAKYLNPYRTPCETDGKVIVPLKKGENTVILRVYNRFEKQVKANLRLARSQDFYRMTVRLDRKYSESVHQIRMTAVEAESPHSNIGLHNVSLKLK